MPTTLEKATLPNTFTSPTTLIHNAQINWNQATLEMGLIFHVGEFTVTPASQEHCSSSCNLFAAYCASKSPIAYERAGKPLNY